MVDHQCFLKILIKREKCERKIKLESVLLRAPSKMHLEGHQGRVVYAHISVWMEPHLLNTFCLNIGIQNNVPET